MPHTRDKAGPYELIELIGKGGNGEVWRARGPDGEVAVKLLKRRAPSDAAPRFKREIQTLVKLRGIKGVLPIIATDATTPAVQASWFAMPLATPIRARIGTNNRLSEVCVAIGGIAAALARVHAAGIAHRDIKPDNLYWYNDEWCIGDFGLAEFADAIDLTPGDRKLGPAYYIAPEMLNSPHLADGQPADVYSLGKVLWVLASGQNYPLPGVHDPAVPGVGIFAALNDSRAAGVDELIRRMTQLDPSLRMAANDVARELAILGASPTEDTAMPNVEAALQRLRGSVESHLSLQSNAKRQSEMLDATEHTLSEVIERIASTIESSTRLQPERWTEIPNYWTFRASIGSPRVMDERAGGLQFVAGGDVFQWRLGIGYRCDLLSSGDVHVCIGFWTDRLLNGTLTREMRGSVPWYKCGTASNGTPSCALLVKDLIKQLGDHLGPTLEEYSARVVEASR